jgi:synaptic vesicle membrane protein VAT-1
MYPDAPPIPCVVGYEASGVVSKVGRNVTAVKPGDRVMAMTRFGGYTSELIVPWRQAVKMPKTMTFREGAALPVVYLTAYHAMFYTGTLHPKSRVLIHSIAGGVGLAALQLAKTKGCTVYGTASTSKHDYLREAGCDFPIDSREDYLPNLERALDGKKLDLILDPIGGASWKHGYRLLGPAGRLVCFGLSAAAGGKTRNLFNALLAVMQNPKFAPMTMMTDNKSVTGINMAHMFDSIDLLVPQLDELVALYEQGVVKPVVAKCFSFTDAPTAHTFLHDRKAIGKVLLCPDACLEEVQNESGK